MLLCTAVGIVPYIALQLKAVASGYALLATPLGTPVAAPGAWWRDSTSYFAFALAGFTCAFGAHHQGGAEKHEGMAAAIAFESHPKRAAWVFPLYRLLINLFVLPIALGGLLYFGPGTMDADSFVLSLPLASGHGALALLVFTADCRRPPAW